MLFFVRKKKFAICSRFCFFQSSFNVQLFEILEMREMVNFHYAFIQWKDFWMAVAMISETGENKGRFSLVTKKINSSF